MPGIWRVLTSFLPKPLTLLGSYVCYNLFIIKTFRNLYRNEAVLREGIMKTTMLPVHPDAKSPAGADIRYLMDGKMGNMIHSTVPPHQINRATVHASVSEFWYILEGQGEIWRDDGVESSVVDLVPGTAIDIPVGTAFQYRNVSDAELKFICIAMPPWPGDSEATYVKGKWQPTI